MEKKTGWDLGSKVDGIKKKTVDGMEKNTQVGIGRNDCPLLVNIVRLSCLDLELRSGSTYDLNCNRTTI